MAYRTGTGDGKKIILMLLFIIVLIAGGIVLVDFVGSLVGMEVPLPGISLLRRISNRGKIAEIEDPYLLAREELQKERERLAIERERLLNREKEVSAQELNVEKIREDLEKREKDLERKSERLEAQIKQHADIEENIREQAINLVNMPPEKAVELLAAQDESDIVDILRAIDTYSAEIGAQSTTPYLLSLLIDVNKEKADNVLRKLKYSAGDDSSSVDILENLDEDVPNP